MGLEGGVLDGVPFYGDVSRVIDAFFHLGRINGLAFLEGYGDELGFGIHVDALLEPFLVDELQLAQLRTDSYGAGGAAEPLDVEQGDPLFLLEHGSGCLGANRLIHLRILLWGCL